LLGFKAVLLTGALSASEKRAARKALRTGEARLAVGSQALISPATIFSDLSLAVIDEQHRFGVRQRLALRRKNEAVDILAMSATPIPRSLALTLYGDLDQSCLRGLLPGRSPAKTILFRPEEKAAAYRLFLTLTLAGGGQGFVVTPRIGGETEDQADDAADGEKDKRPSLEDIYEAIKEEARRRGLSGAGATAPIRCLHGRMDAAARAEAMEAFRAGRCRVLAATSIIEVGVDVPAAGVILIEGAEHFGLAQLHQLRGRVGRGGGPGFCLLLPGRLEAAGAARLSALARETDGQALAEMDLALRGPGEQLGLRQSGWPKMSFARLPRDLWRLPAAHKAAEELWTDPSLAGTLARLNLDEAALPLLEDGLAD
jgi:ATP-dependent DNA helicase RecG